VEGVTAAPSFPEAIRGIVIAIVALNMALVHVTESLILVIIPVTIV